MTMTTTPPGATTGVSGGGFGSSNRANLAADCGDDSSVMTTTSGVKSGIPVAGAEQPSAKATVAVLAVTAAVDWWTVVM